MINFSRTNEYFRRETLKLPKKIQPKCLTFRHDPTTRIWFSNGGAKVHLPAALIQLN